MWVLKDMTTNKRYINIRGYTHGIVKLEIGANRFADNVELNIFNNVGTEGTVATRNSVHEAWLAYQHHIRQRLRSVMDEWFEQSVLPVLEKRMIP